MTSPTGLISKYGSRVTRNEEFALRLVKKHTSVPVPGVISSYFPSKGSQPPVGAILMEFIEGRPLDKVWDSLDSNNKERICREIWGFVQQLKAIPRPSDFTSLYQCGADGSTSRDVLLLDLQTPPRPITDDDCLRARINERYLRFNGGSYREHLPDFLPRSETSVFTHGDIAPRNIMVTDSGQISGILDWELSGWYPDYWEYANIQKPSRDTDWMKWMDQTRPHDWDITGIRKARRVLF